MTKRRINILFASMLLIILIGFTISYFLFPEFIGENELDISGIVPHKHWLIFSIPVFLMLLYLQNKFKLLISGYMVNFWLVRILVTIIILSFISVILSVLTLFNIYSYSNYAFTSKTVELTGHIYRKDIKVEGNSRKYYVCFNNVLKLKKSVSKNEFENYSIGDMMNIKAYKGRFLGYYLIKDNDCSK